MEAYKKEMEEYNKTTAAEESSSSCSGPQWRFYVSLFKLVQLNILGEF